MNEYGSALSVLEESIRQEEDKYGDSWVHFFDRYYLAVTHYELKNYQEAIEVLDKVLMDYPEFSDAHYFMGLCLSRMEKPDSAAQHIDIGRSYFEGGYTFNEDASKYEIYPYQITWQWEVAELMLE
jgi:tetratricopeptide (TPR) repeat protein